MIVSDIITRVRRSFGDEAAVQIQDADIIRWINDAQIELVQRNDEALQKTAFVNLVANQATYTMPTDLLILRSLRYKYADMLSYSFIKYKNMQEFDAVMDGWDGSLYGPGNPMFFTRYEGNVILFPTPDRSQTNGLKVLYNRAPVDVVNSASSLDLPLLYHNTIVKYCMWQATLLDEDNEVAVMHQNNFEANSAQLSNREIKDVNSTYPTITVLEMDQ